MLAHSQLAQNFHPLPPGKLQENCPWAGRLVPGTLAVSWVLASWAGSFSKRFILDQLTFAAHFTGKVTLDPFPAPNYTHGALIGLGACGKRPWDITPVTFILRPGSDVCSGTSLQSLYATVAHFPEAPTSGLDLNESPGHLL